MTPMLYSRFLSEINVVFFLKFSSFCSYYQWMRGKWNRQPGFKSWSIVLITWHLYSWKRHESILKLWVKQHGILGFLVNVATRLAEGKLNSKSSWRGNGLCQAILPWTHPLLSRLQYMWCLHSTNGLRNS